MKAQQQK